MKEIKNYIQRIIIFHSNSYKKTITTLNFNSLHFMFRNCNNLNGFLMVFTKKHEQLKGEKETKKVEN